MSAELTKARQQLAQVRAYLKQNKPVPAVQALQSALLAFLKNQLMKAEREEFERLFGDALAYINNDTAIRAAYPIQIDYAPGQERALYDLATDMLSELGKGELEEAQEQMRLKQQKKKEWFERGVAELATSPQKGKATLVALLREFPDDPMLRGDVGEALLRAQMYEEAVTHLSEALDQRPDILPLYNSIGIALRKLGRFPIAESYYLRASQYLRHDPNLYFNIGRLYVDWKKWKKAVQAAETALKLNPDFVEAQKLLRYAENQLQNAS